MISAITEYHSCEILLREDIYKIIEVAIPGNYMWK